ncbi:GTP-binding protein, partial [Brevundimonas aveniformis]|uniref:GTP-binding protein n=1 Tax=Brevundimonas aveniformis TaxID=370977 RepID=UPI002491C809
MSKLSIAQEAALAAASAAAKVDKNLAAQAARRRTFAIIAHPDAGKTTLTEHILLAGGAIRAAGAVRARGEARRTRSDWMKIEKERGISVSASVMTFEFEGGMFNLLDTPGHEDFSEDTYRTLTAADCAIMVLDAAKGIEPQTLKLFEVCRLRDIPIITFINKLDREAQDPMALLDEIASRLQLDPSPIWWPSESGNRLRGMAKIGSGEFIPFTRPGATDVSSPESEANGGGGPRSGGGGETGLSLSSPGIEKFFDGTEQADLSDALELVEAGYKPFDHQAFLEGHMTPVLWGSALRHFGIDELLRAIADWAPPPKPLPARKEAPPETRNAPAPVDITVQPGDAEVTGFVFKVQANMDPNHRDRIAMFRMASGSFKRG